MKRRGNYNFLEHFTYYLPGIGGMFALLAWLLVGAILGGLLVLPLGVFLGKGAITEYSTLISYPVMFIPPMIFASTRSNTRSMNSCGRKLDSSHFSPLNAAVCVLLALVGTLAIGFWSDGLIALLPPMPDSLKEALKSLTNGNIWINFVAVSIFAPVFEEWLCRGMVLRGLLAGKKMKPAWAIVISAVFFALIHMNPWQAIPAFLAGCLLGYVYYRTGSLKLTMLMHFANNTLALVVGHIDSLKDAESWLDIMPVQQYSVIAAACILLTIMVVLAFRKVKLNGPEGNMDSVPSLFEA